jgi:DNA-binding SARP family transcriptional activator/tetratricopeptide (TPR) repeat protein/TolB-like protein
MLRLRCFGPARLDGVVATGLSAPRKQLALLAYLALQGHRPTSRSVLASLFWEDRDEPHARQSLRQALLELKRLVGEGLVAADDRIHLLPDAIVIDALEFESLLAQGDLSDAAALYEGELLEGAELAGGEEFRSWLEAERERLRRAAGGAFGRLVSAAVSRGNWDEGITWTDRSLAVVPFDENAPTRLIEGMLLGGRTADAITRHAQVVARLRGRGVEPSAELVALGVRLDRGPAPKKDARSLGSAALFSPDFVGRDHALAELGRAWSAAGGGSFTAVLVEAELGLGKTRLCDEFVQRCAVSGSPPRVFAIRGARERSAAPSAGLESLLAGIADAPGLAAASAGSLAELAVRAPALRDRFPSLPAASGQTAALGRALGEAFTVVAEERPVIVLLEDLAGIDGESLHILMLALSTTPARVMFLATARIGEGEPVASAIGLYRLRLPPLGECDTESLLASMLMMPAPARHRLAELLHAACGGNPLHTVEVIAALVDEELLTPAPDGTWQAAGAEHWPLPSGLREAIGRRIARLGPEAGGLLDAGAVLGHVFRRDIAASVAGLDPPAAEAAAGELISRRLIRPVAGSEETLEFVHELVTRVAYERVPVGRRGRLHRAAARAWRGRRGDPAAAAAATRHARQARAAGRWRWWGRVGLAAAAVLAVTVGATLFAIGPERRATLATLVTRPGATLVPNRIVVAPLANRTGDSTLASIGDMAADWIARGLTRTAQFEVVDPRTAWMTAKLVDRIPRLLRPGEAAIAIAEETGSGLVVSGSYYRAGDSLRFEVQITDVASHNLSRVLDPVSAPIGEPASALPTLARRTVATVATAADTLSVGLAAGLSQPPSQQAYEEVSRAWESFWRGDTTDLFARTARARSFDAEYMPPRLMEAYVRSLQGQWPAVDSIVREVDEQRARLTPVESAILDGLHANLRGDRPGRVRAARDLARLTPGSFEGYTLLAEMALAVNDPHQALEALSQVDPDRGLLLLSPIYWQTSARALHQLGRYRDELTVARRGVRKFPDDLGPHVALVRVLAALGRVDELEAELARPLATGPEPGFDEGYRLLAAAAELRTHGHAEDAIRILQPAFASPPPPAAAGSVDGERIVADLFYEAGQWADAGRRYGEVLARHPADMESLIGVGASAAHLGDRAEATRVAELLAHWTQPFPLGRNTYGLARITAVSGDSTRAIALLEQSFREGYPVVSIWERHAHTERDFVGLERYASIRAVLGFR